MLEFFKKAIFAGLGSVVITKKKVSEVMKRLQEEGKISAKEAENLTKEIIEVGEKEFETYKEEINNALKNSVKSLGLVKKEDLAKAMEKISKLEDRIAKLENTLSK
ncbi:hypothetical protein JCM13304A_23830 [Desulfothermus okinawensis JCM 13304]